MSKHIAIYVRVSRKSQKCQNQMPDLKRWIAANSEQPVKIKWYIDHGVSGKTMNRPGWIKLESAIRQGKVSAIVVWRLDRLGRTTPGLSKLFHDLIERRINLVSMKEGIDLATSAGRLIANVLASVAQYESEVIGERISAGLDRVRAEGKSVGGSKKGARKKLKPLVKLIKQMKANGDNVSTIARTLKISRMGVYSVLREQSATA